MNIIPITLEGDNLGKRHQYLNSKVNEAFESNVPFESIRDLAEHSPIDRIFKIDLAIKYRNVDYILQNLKDKDMLFVSRAMKCPWLVQDPQYSNIINAIGLEENLLSQMLTTASNKMKHWIQRNLKDKHRCQVFYEIYQSTEIDFALKFLPKCPVEYFLREMEWIPLNKLTPQLLKLLCEQSTKAAEIYFKKLIKESKTDNDYVRHLQFLLKTDSDLYFYILENVFVDGFKRLSKDATKYIMKHHRHRFEGKSELYAARLLNLPALAKYLNSEERKQLIIKLARAEECFGRHWLTYKFVQPLIKGVDPIERSDFAIQIFEDKLFGDKVHELPYHVPSALETKFIDDELDSDYENYDGMLNESFRQCFGMAAAAAARHKKAYRSLNSGKGFAPPTSLDRLFNVYRFTKFNTTFNELRIKIKQESSPGIRQNMMLVLVSKCGGRHEYIDRVLQLMVRKHRNEPPSLRAAIVRSLVRRAAVWRVHNYIFDMLLELTHDLGLDGRTPSADCHEGLHAVVLRHILNETPCPLAVWTAFLRNFSSFTEYSLNAAELNCLHTRLPTLLMNTAEADLEKAPKRLTQLLDALAKYRLRVDSYPRVITLISNLATRNPPAAKELLRRLFDSRVARKRLFKENFQIIQTDASYLNALRHDAGMLIAGNEFETLLDSHTTKLHHEEFLRKLAIYFGEDGGLAVQYLNILEKKAIAEPNMRLARPIALLTGAAAARWPTLPKPADELKQKAYRRMMTELFANEHLSRQKPQPKLHAKDTSLKAMANWLHTCSPAYLKSNMATVLVQPRLARLVMSLRSPNWPGLIAETLPTASRQRGVRAFCVALRMLRRHPNFLPQDFDVLLPLIPKLNFEGKKEMTYHHIVQLNRVPKYIRADYSLTMHQALAKVDTEVKNSSSLLITLPLVECMSNNVNRIDPNYVKHIIKEFLEKDFTLENVNKQNYYLTKYIETYMKLIARFILVNNSEIDQKLRLKEVCQSFFEKVKTMWNEQRIGQGNSSSYFCYFLKYLKYTRLFLDETESSLPALEVVKSFCGDIAPIHENFGMNYGICLNIVYRNAVKLSFKERPDLFKDDELYMAESRNLIAFNFGKMVAQDVEKLVSRYFASIRPIYCNYLSKYLRTHFHHNFVRTKYTIYFIKGLINDETKLNGVLMGVSLYNKLFVDWHMTRSDSEKALQEGLWESIKEIKTEKVKFFLNYSDIEWE